MNNTYLYVSTSLDTFEEPVNPTNNETGKPTMPLADDFRLDARARGLGDNYYRKLDPTYFAWLLYRVRKARDMAESRSPRLDYAKYIELRLRFEPVRDWAIKRWGEGAIKEAIKNLPADYRPPGREKWLTHAG